MCSGRRCGNTLIVILALADRDPARARGGAAVNSDLKGAAVYRTIVFLTYPLMSVAVAIVWRWIYDERGGFINFVLRGTGLIKDPIPFLQSFGWALPSVILADIWQMIGFYMIILLTGLQSIPQHLYEAARIDGAPAGARFLRITLPMLRPSLFICAVIGILNSFTAFDLVYVMTGGGPAHATELLVTHIYNMGFGETRFDYAAALTVVHFALLVSSPASRTGPRAAMPARWRTPDAKAHASCAIHLVMILVCALMLVPFYWVAKTAVTRREHLCLPAAHPAARSASL